MGLEFSNSLQNASYGASQQSVINGNFSNNQRAVSGSVVLAAGAYGHDRWKAGASGCSYTFATVNNVTTLTISAGSLIQVIDGINLYSGTYTLSWTGTAQGKIGAGSYSASGITGTAIGGTNLSIEFNTGTLSKVQFNAGSSALTFQPNDPSEVLLKCQRFAIAYTDANVVFPIGVGYAISTTQAQIHVELPQTMRTAPLLTATVSDWILSDGVTGIDLTAISIAASSNKTVTLLCTVGAGLTQFRPYKLTADGTANRLMIFDAEL